MVEMEYKSDNEKSEREEFFFFVLLYLRSFFFFFNSIDTEEMDRNIFVSALI